jgi:hypothetical protein
MITHSEVNGFQDPVAGTWTVQRLEWHDGEYVADRVIIAEGIVYKDLDKWFAWGNLSK